jgi:hypothetical protein
LASIEMKFFGRTAGWAFFDHKRNEDISKELKVEPAEQKLRRYKLVWLRYVTRLKSSMTPKILLNCRQNGGRRLGSHLKRLLDVDQISLLRPN